MARTCPSCKSDNVRRSKVRKSEETLRHVLLSPYRCRNCFARFWVLSRYSYYMIGLLGTTVALGAIIWSATSMIDVPRSEPAAAKAPAVNVVELVKLANDNDPGAEIELAHMYANGEGVTKSVAEEIKWLERAARHGNAAGQYEYGIALRDGHGTVQDYEGARHWLQVAAEAGYGPAQFSLGMMYRAGLGVPVDNVKAYIWLNIAAAKGEPGASTIRDVVVTRLSPAELQEAQAEARRLSALRFPKAAPAQ